MTAYDDAAQLLGRATRPGPVRAASLWIEAVEAARLARRQRRHGPFAERARSVYEARETMRASERHDAPRSRQVATGPIRRGRRAAQRGATSLLQALERARHRPTPRDTTSSPRRQRGEVRRCGTDAIGHRRGPGARTGIGRRRHHLRDACWAHEPATSTTKASAGSPRCTCARAADSPSTVATIRLPQMRSPTCHRSSTSTGRPKPSNPVAHAFDLLSPLGDRHTIGYAVINLALAQLAIGDWDAAHETLFTLPHPHVLEHSGLVRHRASNGESAAGRRRCADGTPRPGWQPDLRRPAGACRGSRTGAAFAAEARGDRADALRLALESLDLVREPGCLRR